VESRSGSASAPFRTSACVESHRGHGLGMALLIRALHGFRTTGLALARLDVTGRQRRGDSAVSEARLPLPQDAVQGRRSAGFWCGPGLVRLTPLHIAPGLPGASPAHRVSSRAIIDERCVPKPVHDDAPGQARG